jgi:hypothetical protein
VDKIVHQVNPDFYKPTRSQFANATPVGVTPRVRATPEPSTVIISSNPKPVPAASFPRGR